MPADDRPVVDGLLARLDAVAADLQRASEAAEAGDGSASQAAQQAAYDEVTATGEEFRAAFGEDCVTLE